VGCERQGQTAAPQYNSAGASDSMPCRSSGTSQYDFTLNYVGHAEKWDKLDLDAVSRTQLQALISARRNALAVATVGRDRESLEKQFAIELPKRRVVGRLTRN